MQDETNKFSPDSTDRIDALCDAFEDAWSADVRPSIESFLEMIEAPLRPKLLRALLPVECELLRRFGATPHKEDYHRRFSEHGQVVSEVFRFQRGLDASRFRLGNYELLEKIGAGGMGAVYKARHTSLNKFVAVKLLPHDYLKNEQSVARFRREMQAVGKLDHPNIVRAMDAGEVDGTQYLVMEFAEGVDLRQLVVNRGPLIVDEAIDFVIQAAWALDYAHRHGLIHRDVKPSNLLYCANRPDTASDDTKDSRDDLFGHIKVLDLGLARIDDESAETGSLTATGTVMGTVDYMSLEQAEDLRKADARSDIYSLGCTLFFLVTGRPPYQAETQTLRLLAHREQPVPSLSAALAQRIVDESKSNRDKTCLVGDSHELSQLPVNLSKLEAVFQRMVAKRPEDRFASMAKVARALADAQTSQVSSTGPGVGLPLDGTKTVEDQHPVGTRTAVLGLSLVAVIAAFGFLRYGPKQSPPDPAKVTESSPMASTALVGPSRDGSNHSKLQRDPVNAESQVNVVSDAIIPGREKSTPTGPPSEVVNAERRAAEWVLRIGGTLQLKFTDESVRRITEIKDLPDKEFVVHEINVSGNSRVNDHDVRKNLTGLSGLVSLQIHHTTIGDLALEVFKNSPILTNLHLESTSVTDAGIKALGRLPRLVDLQLNQTLVTADCLPALMDYPELRHLDIGSIPASDSAAKVLLGMSRWLALCLNESWIQPDNIVKLAEQLELRILLIYGDLPVSRLRLLAGLPHLTNLCISDHRMWSPELSVGLTSLPHLDAVSLIRVAPSLGWKEFGAARPWRELEFGYMHVPDEAFHGLDECDSLLLLTLTRATYSRSRLQRFRAEHPRVNVASDMLRPRDHDMAERLLRMGGVEFDVYDQRGVHYVRRPEDLPDTEFQLVHIYVNDCPTFDDRVLESLARLEIHALGLAKCGVTDAGMSALDLLTTLRFLNINDAKLNSPAVLRVIARQSQLESLNLPTCSVEQLLLLAPLKLTSLSFGDLDAESAADILERAAQQFPSLTTLALGRLILEAKMAEAILKLPMLHYLQGQSAMLTPKVVPILARHPSLTKIDLFGTQLMPWPSLASLQRIQTVHVGTNALTNIHIERLAELPQLQTLTIDRSPLSPEALSAMSKLRHVAKIQFTGCEIDDSSWKSITDALPNSRLLWNGEPRKL